MFGKMKLWGTSKRRARTSGRRNSGLRFEPLESRQLLAVLTPAPLVSAGIVGNDLVITGSAPEMHVKITETAGVITVEGLTQEYLGTDGDMHTVQTDVNNSGDTSADFDFSATTLRDLKIKLSGVDSILEVAVDDALITRDLIVSMPASTSSTALAKAGIETTSHLCIDIDGTDVGRNLTITTGAGSTAEEAVIDINDDTIGSVTKGTLKITTNGDVANMIGLSATTVNTNVTMTTGAGDDLISVVGVTLATPAGVASGTLTISAGAGENTVLVDDNFGEVIESSMETFVTNASGV